MIDASVTLEDFEEQERQIVKELNDPVDVLESKSLQNPQSLVSFFFLNNFNYNLKY